VSFIGALCALITTALAVAGAIRYARVAARNLRGFPAVLREVAGRLGGAYHGRGLFGRRPRVSGHVDNVPVEVDFPDVWRLASWADTRDAKIVWCRVRLAQGTGRPCRVTWKDARGQLERLGVPARALRQAALRQALGDLLEVEGADLSMGRRAAVARTPVTWDVDALPAARVLGIVAAAADLARAVRSARGEGAPAGTDEVGA